MCEAVKLQRKGEFSAVGKVSVEEIEKIDEVVKTAKTVEAHKGIERPLDIENVRSRLRSESTILNYSSSFEDSLVSDFNKGYKVMDVVEKDVILVQFSSDSPNASLRYWTTVDEANGISTIEEYMDKMALSKEWGNRNIVKVARLKAGTRVKHAIGTAKAQLSLIDPRPGKGIQVLFNKFDPCWITEVRELNK